MPPGCQQLVIPLSAHTTASIPLAADSLRQFGHLRLRATGGSMLPAIAPGDVLVFRVCKTTDRLDIGQVVLVQRGEGFVIHRLVAVTGAGVITRGDALRADDPPVCRSQLLGVLAQQQRQHRSVHAGGRHWLKRQRLSRFLVRRVHLVHRVFQRYPVLADLIQ